MTRRGFTLVEVLVALLVLEVGLLGVVGTLVLAAATLADAAELERAVTVMEAAYDQAARGVGPADGQVPVGAGWVRWSRDASGSVVVRHLDGSGAELAVVAGSGGTDTEARP